MKILHIISSSGMYGAEAVILNLSSALIDKGHSSGIAAFLHAGQPNIRLLQAAAAAGIGTHSIPCRGQLDRAALRSIANLASESKADVIHAHGYKADVYTWLALRQSRAALVSTCHNWLDTDVATKVYGALDRLILRNYDGVVAVSTKVQQRLVESGVAARKVSIVRNGISLAPFSGPPKAGLSGHPLVVGFAGRLSHEKGADLFLRAAASVLKELPATQFVIAGDGPEHDVLDRLRTTLGIGASVSMIGRCEDMPAFYRSLDLLVSSSRTEGLPMGLLEGMASRLPVVATSVGNVPMVVDDGVTGILVPPEDSHGLAQAMIHLLRAEALRREFGEAGRTRIEKEFSAERMAQEYVEVYRKAIHASLGRRRQPVEAKHAIQ